jgi:type I restriction enzyme S subunit
MTPRDLIAAFETLADAPDGVTRLRELVLQMAVRGRLVPQDPADESAHRLLDYTAIERARLVHEQRLRRPKKVEPIAELVQANPWLPESWAWCRLGSLAFFLSDGSHNPPKDVGPDGIPMLSGKNVRDGFVTLDASRYVSEADLEVEHRRYTVEPQDVLICIVGSIGRSAVVPDGFPRVALQRSAALVRVPTVVAEYVTLVIRSPLGQDFLSSHAKGTAQLGVYLGTLANTPIPLPPLAEQHRIVARVDELMGLLDRLEAARDARDATRAALRDSALEALRDANDAEEVELAWARIAEHMDDLFTAPEDVAPLRQTILQLAVRGRLVPQDPEDEPASVLLERIADEKARLVKEGKIRKPKVLPPIDLGEVPFEVPEGWEWCRLEMLTSEVTSGSRGWNKYYSVSGATFIRSQDIKNDRLQYDNRAYVAVPCGSEGTRTRVAVGDLLITITGANVGKCALLVEAPDEGYVSQHVALVRPLVSASGNFLHVWLTCNFAGRGLLIGDSYGAKPGLNLSQLRELPIPMPSLAEQHRIVARVDQLMALCDALEEKLTAATTVRGQFAAAAVHNFDA